MKDKRRVFERGPNRACVAVTGDERRADAGAGGMHEQDGAAPVHLGVDRLELGFGDRAIETNDVHVDANAAQLVKAALHLLQGGVDMGQRQHDVGGDALRIAVGEVGVAVVQHLHRVHAFGLVRQIGRVVRRQYLLFDAGRIHQLEPPLDVLRRIRERMACHSALDRQMNRRRKPVTHELAEILWRVVRVHVDDHGVRPSSGCCSRATVNRAPRKTQAAGTRE